MDLSRKMTLDEYKQLSDEDKKERKRLQNRKYREENKEKDKEKNKERHRKYYQENKEKDKERKRKYYEENREEILSKKKKYGEEHREELNERSRKYREDNPEYFKEYDRLYKQSPAGKKVNTISQWKTRGLDETDEELDIIYELYLHQELCYSCDVKLTRDGVCSTQAVLDHDHTTKKFRQICCRACNNNDSWMKYWC